MKQVYLVLVIVFALGMTSCHTIQSKKADDDFYDFNKKPSSVERKVDKETTPTKQRETYTAGSNKAYVKNSSETYTKSKSNVSSRFEKVEIIAGKIDTEAKYYIILGSFSEKANADRLSEKLAKQGFAPNILRSPAGLYRVSGYYFNDERAARIEVAEVRQKFPEYSDLWLLIKK